MPTFQEQTFEDNNYFFLSSALLKLIYFPKIYPFYAKLGNMQAFSRGKGKTDSEISIMRDCTQTTVKGASWNVL